MTKAAKDFNARYGLKISDSSFKRVSFDTDSVDLKGKPKTNISQILKRFFTNYWAVLSLLVFVIIVIIALVVKYTSIYNPNLGISDGRSSSISDIKNLDSSSKTIQEWIGIPKWNKIQNINTAAGHKVIHYDLLKIYNGKYYIKWNPFDLVNAQDGIKHHSVIGTDSVGRDAWTRSWVGTWNSLVLSIFVVTITTTIGTLLGSWIGLYVGTIVDILFMKIIAIYNSIPTIIWYALILFILPTGWWALVAIFVITGWMRGMGTARMFMWKYVNSDFMKSAEVSGVSKFGRILKHALPNYLGIVIIGFVSAIPGIIEGEASLAFLGFSPSPSNASLGNVLNEAQQAVRGSEHIWYLLTPTLIIFTITISLKFVALGINDSINPKFKGRK